MDLKLVADRIATSRGTDAVCLVWPCWSAPAGWPLPIGGRPAQEQPRQWSVKQH